MLEGSIVTTAVASMKSGKMRREGQHALLLAAALRDVVLLDQGVLAMKGNGVEIQIQRTPSAQPRFLHALKPGTHDLRIAPRFDPTAVLGKKGPLRDHVESGKQCQALIRRGCSRSAWQRLRREASRRRRPAKPRSADGWDWRDTEKRPPSVLFFVRCGSPYGHICHLAANSSIPNQPKNSVYP